MPFAHEQTKDEDKKDINEEKHGLPKACRREGKMAPDGPRKTGRSAQEWPLPTRDEEVKVDERDPSGPAHSTLSFLPTTGF